jgi:methyltransferase
MILVHAGWLAGLWMPGHNQPVVPAYLIAFLILQIGRYWVLAALGRRWTTRVIVLPGAAHLCPGISCALCGSRISAHPS